MNNDGTIEFKRARARAVQGHHPENIKIAEWVHGGLERFDCYHRSPFCACQSIPNYRRDLNAMSRALAVVKERGGVLMWDYSLELYIVCNPNYDPKATLVLDVLDLGSVATATAAQRAEALVRMIEQDPPR